MLASGGHDGTVRLWDTTTGGQISMFTGHIGYVTRVSFGRDNKTLASFSHQDGNVYMWDLDTELPKFTISGYLTAGTTIEQQVIFSPDGKTLASIDTNDGAIHLWDVATGRERALLNGCLGVGEFIRSVSFSTDGKTLASGGSDDMVRLWDVASGRETAVLKHAHVESVIFSPDGKTLAIRSASEVRLWDVDTKTEKSVLSHALVSEALVLVRTVGRWQVQNLAIVKCICGMSTPGNGSARSRDIQRASQVSVSVRIGIAESWLAEVMMP